MIIKYDQPYFVTYKPTKACRRTREDVLRKTDTYEIREVTEGDAPLAFVVHSYRNYFDESIGHTEFGLYTTEIRAYNGELYTKAEVIGGDQWGRAKTLDEIRREIEPGSLYAYPDIPYSEESVIIADNAEERRHDVHDRAAAYCFIDGICYKKCGEPFYMICAQGSDISIRIAYSNWTNADNFQKFNALEREEILKRATDMATRSNSHRSLDRIMNSPETIAVLMPEMVSIPYISKTYSQEAQEAFTRKCYEKYKMSWLLSHDFTLKDLFEQLQKNAETLATDGNLNSDVGAALKAVFEGFEDTGFDGTLYACYEEFRDSEFSDHTYMESLLDDSDFKYWMNMWN